MAIMAIVRAGFPGCATRRDIRVTFHTLDEGDAPTRCATYNVSDYWSEGSRNECQFVELATLRAIPATAMPSEARQKQNNPFNLACAEVPISPGFAIVEHTIMRGKDLGYHVYLHASNVAPLLPAKPAGNEATDREKSLLAIFSGIKAGPYRREYLASAKATDAEVDALVARGFLKRASNGATTITREGKAACEGVRVS